MAVVRVEGLAELRKELRRLESGQVWAKELREAHKDAAERAVPEVKRRTPVLTGALQRTVRALATQRGSRVVVGGIRGVEYAGPINYGWAARNIRAQEFLMSGVNAATDDILEIYIERLDDITARAFPTGRL